MQRQKKTIKIASFNVEGITNNNMYAQEIFKNADIVLIQEHWLFKFEQNRINSLIGTHSGDIISVDEFDNISMHGLPRGWGGVALTWIPSLHPVMKNGITFENNRIISKKMIINENTTILLVNVYLPSITSSDRQNKLCEYLNTLECIRSKLSAPYPYPIILMGDMNIDPFQEKNENDTRLTALKNLTSDLGLTMISDGKLPTCIGHGERFKSHLDLVFVSACLINCSTVTVSEKVPWNTSVHTPVYLTIELSSKLPIKEIYEKKKVTYRVNRKSINKEIFLNEMQNYLNFPHLHPSIATEYISLSIKAAEITAGTLMRVTSGCFKIRTVHNIDIINAAKKSREVNHLWKSAGRPDKDHPLSKLRRKTSNAVRAAHRKCNSRKREAYYNKIMSCKDPKELAKLIKSCTSSSGSSSCPKPITDHKGITHSTSKEGADAWADYFEALCSPEDGKKNHWDDELHSFVKDMVKTIRQTVKFVTAPKDFITQDDVMKSIKRLKHGKAADIYGISPDHIIMSAPAIANTLSSAYGHMVDSNVPENLKKEKKVPVPKKYDQIMDHFRGITIPPTLGKLLENIILSKIDYLSQSSLQFGFTAGLSPQMATLCLTELVCSSKAEKKQLILTTIDASKAFDLVDRDILLWELYKSGVPLHIWKVIDDLYSENTCQVIWNGSTSKQVPVLLGTGQGRSIAAKMYKVYINPTINCLTESGYGAKIGHLDISAPSCADDIALAAHSIYNMQGLLSTININTQKFRSKINISKCETISNSKKINKLNFPLILGEQSVPHTDQITHIGLKRNASSPSLNIQEKISTARRAAYALIPAGIHGEGGISPYSSASIIQSRVLQVLLSGLDSVILSKTDIDKLNVYYNSLIRSMTGLKKSNAVCSLMLMTGLLPIECELHCRILTLYGAVCRMDGQSILKMLAMRQLATPSHGWFEYASAIAQQYDLELNFILNLYQPCSASKWKKLVKDRIRGLWFDKLCAEAENMSSLVLLDPRIIEKCKPHHIWPRRGSSGLRRAASIRAMMMTGTYAVQHRIAKFYKQEEPMCKLCHCELETIPHLLLTCQRTAEIRNNHLPAIETKMTKSGFQIPVDPTVKAKFLLNFGPTRYLPTGKSTIAEKISNEISLLCIKFHNERNKILENHPRRTIHSTAASKNPDDLCS